MAVGGVARAPGAAIRWPSTPPSLRPACKQGRLAADRLKASGGGTVEESCVAGRNIFELTGFDSQIDQKVQPSRGLQELPHPPVVEGTED